MICASCDRAYQAGALAALREVREMVERMSTSAYAKFGSAGGGLMKDGIRQGIDAMIAREEGK